jgi:hypothetical protein
LKQVPEIEVVITKSEPVQPEPEIVREKEEQEAKEEKVDELTSEPTGDLQPQPAVEEAEGGVAENTTYLEESFPSGPEEEPKICALVPIPEAPRVTFIDSIKVTSYKSPEPKEKKTEPIKPILKPSTLPMEEKPAVPEAPVKKPKPRPLVERREADLRPQIKPGIILKPEPPKVEKKKIEKVEEPKPLEEK